MIKVKIVKEPYSFNDLFLNIASGTADIIADIELPCKPQKGDFIIYGVSVQNIVKYVVLVDNEDYIVVII